jgi:single-stranded-DNA-specific exonuclease
MRRNKVWSVAESTVNRDQTVKLLMNNLGISRVLADLLVKRDLTDPQVASDFLYPDINSLSLPQVIPGMESAVRRIEQAVSQQERVVIYGDYDVDGVCSITVLKEYLDHLLPGVGYYIPNRFTEGYGLNSDAVRLIRDQGCQLLITVDCGIASIAEVELARQLGMDVVVTDHHEPGSSLPEAAAVVNPKLNPSGSPELAGVGVAFYLVRALDQVFAQVDPMKWLDVVALGTVADIVPLIGDNRILVREGMKRLRATVRPGLKTLIELSGLSSQDLKYWHIGFVLGPRLNAAGRVEDAGSAVGLLLADDEQEARLLAQKMTVLNTTRQSVEANILEEARLEAAHRVDQGEKVLVLAKEGWHQGVLGIVASRIAEGFERPVIMISWEGQEGKGSGRSAPGFDLYQALDKCRDHLERFGGHQQAAGVVVHRSQIESLRMALNEVAASSWEEDQEPQLMIDGKLEIHEINTELIRELSLLEPFGHCNSSPLFVLRSARILNPVAVGKSKEHLKFLVQVKGQLGKPIEAIGFGMAEFMKQPLTTQLFDLVFEPGINSFRGQNRLQLQIHDMKTSDSLDDPRLLIYHIRRQDRPFFDRMEDCIKNGLSSDLPVVVVYPTVRCLEKHLPGLKRLFPENILVPVHGCLAETVRRRNLHSLEDGRKKVFLTTEAFFRYSADRNNIKHKMVGIALWPTESPLCEDLVDWINLEREPAEPVLVTVSEPVIPESIGSKRRIIYTNRRKTLRKLFRPGDLLEVGIEEIVQRIKVRQQFQDQDNGSIFWDGVFGGGLSPVIADQLILGDPPFGWYEVENSLAQVSGGLAEIGVNFTQQDLSWNSQYLEKLYPTNDYVRSLYERLRDQKGKLRLPQSVLNDSQQEIKREHLTIRSGLKILYQLGLCRLVRQSDSYDIQIVPCNAGALELGASPFYLEGIQEKKILNEMLIRFPFK